MANPGLIISNGQSLITAQLYSHGSPYNKSNINITFESDNIASGIFQGYGLNRTPSGFFQATYNVTDENGIASTFLSSRDKSGRVKVTATYRSDGRAISNSTYVEVTYRGNISGLVIDKNGNGSGNATVTLWNVEYNNSTGRWDNKNIVRIQDNPQGTSNVYDVTTPGLFSFDVVPTGVYNVTAESDGKMAYSLITVGRYTATCIIKIPDYEYSGHVVSGLFLPSYYVPIPSTTNNNGIIWGLVNDFYKHAIDGANVTLWNAKYNDTTDQWDTIAMTNIPDNPQLSNSNTPGLRGAYKFENVPPGDYVVTASFKGYSNYAVAHISNNVSTNFISLLRYGPF